MNRRNFVAGLSTTSSVALVNGLFASDEIEALLNRQNDSSERKLMNQTIESQVSEAEERLRNAMLNSNIDALDRLLAPELLFTNHLGQLQGKQDDLAAYRSGALKVKSLEPSEQHIRVYGDIGIVSVRVQLLGTYAGKPANGDFRFTRVWALSGDKVWRVVAAHAGVVS